MTQFFLDFSEYDFYFTTFLLLLRVVAATAVVGGCFYPTGIKVYLTNKSCVHLRNRGDIWMYMYTEILSQSS